MFGQEEVFIQCPYCCETISMLVEVFETGQSYIEDCEVCCRPIQLDYKIVDNQVEQIQVKRA